MADINAYAQVGDVEGAITASNPLNVVDAGSTASALGIGAKADAAVVDPAVAGSIVALLKGILTQQLAIKADIATMKADIILLKAATGAPADAAYVSGSGSIIAILKAQFAKV